MSRPVGTGPYRLKEWRRASRIVLEANPNYRVVRFPENADAPQQELIRNMRGKTLPQIGRIDISVIEESQPEILAFTQGDLDFIALGGDDTKRVLENGQLPAGSREAWHQARPLRVAERHVHVLQHGRSGWSAATRRSRSRCAARSAWASTSTS